MIGLDVNDVAIVKQSEVLEAALSTNPKTQQALNKLIREVIRASRADVVGAARGAMKQDPRGAARAVRTSVYKKILGANINIYNSRKAHGSTSYEPPRTLRPGQRGGNRIKIDKNSRSYKIAHYEARDRGFILRWLNEGTQPRQAFGGRMSKRGFEASRGGNRGAIAPRNWFRGAAESALVKAADALANMIDEELENMLNANK